MPENRDIEGWMAPQGLTGTWRSWGHPEHGDGGTREKGTFRGWVNGWMEGGSSIGLGVSQGQDRHGVWAQGARTRWFFWQPLPMQHLPASVVQLRLQSCSGVWPHILTAVSLSLESLQEWGVAGVSCSPPAWVGSWNLSAHISLSLVSQKLRGPMQIPGAGIDQGCVEAGQGNLWAQSDHRIPEWLRLEGPTVGHLVPAPCLKRLIPEHRIESL